MTSVRQRLSRVSAALALASALCVPAIAAPGISGEVFVKLPAGASAGGEQIEVESFSWGETHGAEPLAPVFVKSWSTAGSGAAPPPRGGGSNQISMDDTPGKEKSHDLGGWSKAEGLDVNASRAGGTNTVDRNEKITIHGAHTEAKLPGKRTPPTVTLNRGRNNSASGDTNRPIVIGTVSNPPGQAAPMQYNPKELSVSKSNNGGAAARAKAHDKHTTWVERSAPAAKGSVWIRVSSPWAGCRVGTRYPTLELGGGGKAYVLQDVTVASCGGGASPNEVAFYYNRIAFNYAR